MGSDKRSGRSFEQIQRDSMKSLKKKQAERKRREKAEMVRQQNLARLEKEESKNPQSSLLDWSEALAETDLKNNQGKNVQVIAETADKQKRKSARPVNSGAEEVLLNVKRRKSARPATMGAAAPVVKNTVSPSRKSANPAKQHQANFKKSHETATMKKGIFIVAAVAFVVVLGVVLGVTFFSGKNPEEDMIVVDGKAVSETIEMEERILLSPHYIEETNPSNLIASTEINVDGTTLVNVSDYQSSANIDFGNPDQYAAFDGIATFRGNNFRDNPTYGFANMTEFKMDGQWSYKTSSLSYNGVWWTGSGWTGQPLMAKWPKETKAAMNMYDWAKQDDELVEVIYACMDGYIYFLDLQTGKETRDPMYVGYTFKGAGALDPRGYPIMYVGAGYDSNNGTARSFVINLLDCSIMYTFGDYDEFSMRGSLSYFDSSSLVDAETDTLIYPGENGILYLIKLNTQFDPAAGTLSINPGNIVKWRYWGTRSSTSSYWVGMETSAACYGGYLYVADNGGNLMCMDLNTLQLVWVQDILDDSNSTPVLSIENGKLYIYISTSFHLGWRSYDMADVPIWKIDAETGEIIWQTSYACHSEESLSGGVQSTIALGKNQLSDYVYVTVSRTGGYADGVLACLNKNTGEIVWEHEAFYAWSSPVCIYNEDGTGKVLYATCGGNLYLLDGITGEVHDTMSLVDGEGAVEASPAVYNDMLVVGTRECLIWGIKLK